MKKNKGIVTIMIMAVIVGILGGIGLYAYLSPQRTTMYVFSDSYSAGTRLTSEMLIPIQADSRIIAAGKSVEAGERFITADGLSEALKNNDSLRMDVSAGMPLMSPMLTTTGGSFVEMNMDPAKVAISVAITSVTGVTNDLNEGSKVNIYTLDNASGASVLILQDMRVLTTAKNEDGEIKTATIECTQDQALQLVYYSMQGQISFGLVDGSGYQIVDGKPSFAP